MTPDAEAHEIWSRYMRRCQGAKPDARPATIRIAALQALYEALDIPEATEFRDVIGLAVRLRRGGE